MLSEDLFYTCTSDIYQQEISLVNCKNNWFVEKDFVSQFGVDKNPYRIKNCTFRMNQCLLKRLCNWLIDDGNSIST